jgi:sugar lactone lactonase YvrE
VAVLAIVATVGGGAGLVAAKAPPPTGCLGATSAGPGCIATGNNVGLIGLSKKGKPNINDPIPAAAGLYAWGMATAPDGSILTGDYWNYRIVHFEDDETATTAPSEASPYVLSQTTQGFGANTTQAPFGICVDNSGGPFEGYVYETEGSLFDVIQYSPTGNWVTSWGTTDAANPAPFQYPSECTVGPNGYVYISNQWGTPTKALQGVVILDPVRYMSTGSDGSTTSGSLDVSAPDLNLSSADVGAYFYGPNIPDGDTIVNVTSPTQAVLSEAATATASSSAFIVGLTIESPPAPNAFIQPRGLAFDSAGNLWVADQGHSRVDIFYANGSGQVNMDLPPTDSKKTGIDNGMEINPVLCTPGPTCTGTTLTFDMRGVAIDRSSGLAFVANGQGCVVQEFNANPADIGSTTDPYGSFVLNFNNVPISGSDCGTGPGQFEDGARGIAVDGQGNVWVGDLGNFRAQVFNEQGQPLWAIEPPPGPPPVGGFNGPRGVAFDSSGDMYVTDTYNYRIEEFSPTGSSNGGDTYGLDQVWGARGDGPGDFNYARLMCWDPLTPLESGGSGALIVANTDSGMAVGWNTASTPPVVVQTPAGPWDTASGTPPVGILEDPYGVACDPSTGDVYVANSNGGDIVVFNASGTELGTMGTLSKGKLGFTQAIWVDSDGSVWVDSGTNDDVYHFASWANGGGELGLPVNVDAPLGVASGAAGTYGIAGDAGYVYIAFPSINEVGQFVRSGALTATGTCAAALCLVGTFGSRGTAVGKLATPQGLAFGPDSDLYVVEEINNRVSQWAVP